MVLARKYVLVIDDDRTAAQMLIDFLEDKGYEVKTAFTGKAGLAEIAGRIPDLLIVDLFLPDMQGSDVCRQLRADARTKNLPIILCTAHQITTQQKLKGFETGIDDYLVRPFALGELLARMEAVLRRSTQTPALTPAPKKETIPAPVSRPFVPETPAPTPLETPAAGHTPVLAWLWKLLNRPSEIARRLFPHRDFSLSLFLVFSTPVILSSIKLFTPNEGFDAWIGAFSLGVLIHGVLWFATAGLLHSTAPFFSRDLPMRTALILSGLAWAPRLLNAVLNFLYGVIGLALSLPAPWRFSTGLDIVPGLSKFISSHSLWARIGAVEIWSAVILVIVFMENLKIQTKRWNWASAVLVLVCLLFGTLVSF